MYKGRYNTGDVLSDNTSSARLLPVHQLEADDATGSPGLLVHAGCHGCDGYFILIRFENDPEGTTAGCQK